MVDSNPKKKFLAKVVLLGDVDVGKTTLINQFASGNAGNTAATVGTDFKSKQIDVGDTKVTLQLWDTAGQEKHSSIGFAFYRGSNTCILTFDIGNQTSFDRIAFWKKNFLDQAAPLNPQSFPFIVCGNKTDLERKVTREVAEAWCKENGGYPYFETCASSGEGVDTLFQNTGKKAMENAKSNDDDFMPTSLSGASGAIKLDPTTEKAAEEQKKKKKKSCKC